MEYPPGLGASMTVAAQVSQDAGSARTGRFLRHQVADRSRPDNQCPALLLAGEGSPGSCTIENGDPGWRACSDGANGKPASRA